MAKGINRIEPIVILIADDDEEDFMLVRDAFREHQFSVDLRWVKDGFEAMDYLLHRGKYEALETSPRPKLILLDLFMPERDGFDTLMDLKGHSELRRIPVVILTSSRENEHVGKGYELGANAFMVKPLTFAEMIDSMASLYEYWFGVLQLPEEGSSERQ